MVQSSGEVPPRWRELARVVVVVGATAVAVVAGVGPASSGLQPRLLQAAQSSSTLAPLDEVPLPTVTSFARNVTGLTQPRVEAVVDANHDLQADACIPCAAPGSGPSRAIAQGRRRTASGGLRPAPRVTPPAATAPAPPAPAAGPASTTAGPPAPTATPSRADTRPAPPIAAPGREEEPVDRGTPAAGGDAPGRSEDKAEPAAEQQARRDAARSSR